MRAWLQREKELQGIFLEMSYYFRDSTKSEADSGVGGSIIYGYAIPIGYSGAGKHYVRHIAGQFVGSCGGEQIGFGAEENLLRILGIEQYGSHGVAVATAGVDDAVIEHQPSFVGEYRHGAGSDLGALPCAVFEGCHLHDAAVLAPVFHVGGVGDEDIAEGSMAIVGGTGEHGVASSYLLREEHTVAVEGEEGVLTLIEGLEVERIADADSRAVATVTPGDPPAVVNPSDTRIILIVTAYHVGIAGKKLYRGVGDAPVDSIVGKTCIYIHLHSLVVATEHSGISVAKGHDGGIEDGVGDGSGVAIHYRIL